ncbi:hypothetical protein D3C77_687170 [compost metagenome]
MGRLQQVEDAQQAEHPGEQGEGPDPVVGGERQAEKGEQHAEGEEGVAAQQRKAHADSWLASTGIG